MQLGLRIGSQFDETAAEAADQHIGIPYVMRQGDHQFLQSLQGYLVSLGFQSFRSKPLFLEVPNPQAKSPLARP